MKKKIFLIVYTSLTLLLFSKEYVVDQINISGLTRTKYSTVLNIIGVNKGSVVDESIDSQIEQDLLSAGIFQKNIGVNIVNITDTTIQLNIELMERWTLIPIPVGFVSSDSWLAGGVFIESNLLGLNQTLVSGLFVNSEKISGFSAWVNPNFLDSNYSFGLSTSFNRGGIDHLDISGKDVLSSYNEERLALSISLGRDLKWNFGVLLSTGIEGFKALDPTGYLGNSGVDELFFNNSLTLSYKDLYFSNFFTDGWDINLEYKVSSSKNYLYNPSLLLKINRTFLFNDNYLLKTGINSGWQGSIDYKPIFIGGVEGSRVLPSGQVAIEKYADSLVSFEPVIYSPSWGSFTLPVYYEAGIFTSLEGVNEFWHGPGVGFRFYVDKVAIPALGADFTWDLERGLFKVAVSVGGTGGG
ncbi:hypothetical protein EW093_04110 [Thiospirochaeta perfilievii]|uniref:Uncharacterized protein n=1 Tax=Thiospirochaeta perfilievii TaxID=252967 RepID=A0A5C1Q7B5_9SPIO|nr:POTRA domain-containing protein [Thiospirochaeta perfilievii]QEN03915.1 hypothetical protein EW093_04110 [Thiospirochaeta perfilievii]